MDKIIKLNLTFLSGRWQKKVILTTHSCRKMTGKRFKMTLCLLSFLRN